MAKDKSWRSAVKEYLPLFYLVVALLALRYSLVEPYVVPTPSMEPTLKMGDRLYALKCAYDLRFPFTDWVLLRFKPVRRGDVILFRAPHEPDKIYVKRAVAVEGDEIEVKDGVLMINGKAVDRKVHDGPDGKEVMYDIAEKENKTLYIENDNGVKHYMILDNYNPHSRNYPDLTQGLAGAGPTKVPKGFVFAMGDNRDQSYDSRAWSFVPLQNLKGQAMFIWFSSLGWRVRPERIGTLIQ